MEVSDLKGYSLAVSDLEGKWSPEFKRRIKKISQKIIMEHLTGFDKIILIYLYLKEKRKASRLDLTEIEAKGMTNSIFINQQLNYICMFSALSKVLSMNQALEIMYKVMDATAGEMMYQNTPTIDEIKSFGDTMTTFQKYFEPLPEASRRAGCHQLSITEKTEKTFKIDITYCAWLELAKKMDIPEACLPNCHADDYAYPQYYSQLGIKYSRSGTLAQGCKSCSLKFERIDQLDFE